MKSIQSSEGGRHYECKENLTLCKSFCFLIKFFRNTAIDNTKVKLSSFSLAKEGHSFCSAEETLTLIASTLFLEAQPKCCRDISSGGSGFYTTKAQQVSLWLIVMPTLAYHQHIVLQVTLPVRAVHIHTIWTHRSISYVRSY